MEEKEQPLKENPNKEPQNKFVQTFDGRVCHPFESHKIRGISLRKLCAENT